MHKIKSFIKHVLRKKKIHANFLDGNYRNIIWLIGDGRSGTTWVSNLINYKNEYRELFEPFHPKFISKTRFLIPHLYVRPNEENKRLAEVAGKILSGEFNHHRIDFDNQGVDYTGLLVKDVFANLFAYWAHQRFPEVKIILLIRNPFAVALSKKSKEHWYWELDPLNLWRQENLREDYLAPFEKIIKETVKHDDFILNQIVIWCIINYVPLKQFPPDAIEVLFYEDVYCSPETSVASALSIDQAVMAESFDQSKVTKLSKVTGSESTFAQGKSPITSWMSELSEFQIENGMKILEAFGLMSLYDKEGMPVREALTALQARSESVH